ncbi:septum formation family protein [Streptomyces sp. SBT349]|uniref:septum formation family protein n=1 Tax=Streptomyces sp. SBT349 TaxID=1580539 RepID=UPI00131D2313|nr:septum formation family protein [Streptomyces sp. SBT349]
MLALTRPRTRPERGRALAVGAVMIAAAQVLVLAVVVPTVVMDGDDRGRGSSEAGSAPEQGEGEDPDAPGAPDGSRPPEDPEAPGGPGDEEPTSISVYDIEVGDCFDSGVGLDEFGSGGAEEMSVTRLACDGPHEAEAYGSTQVEGYDSFPGDDEMYAVALSECNALVQGYVLDTWTLPLDVSLFYYHPGAESWGAGDREIICLFGEAGGGSLDGTLRGDTAELDAGQLLYLEVTTPLEVMIWEEPLPEEDIALRREWAGRMAESIEREAAALEAEAWPEEIAGLVTELVAARRTSLEDWNAAAGAAGSADFDQRIEAGYAGMGIDVEIEIREILGLSTGE